MENFVLLYHFENRKDAQYFEEKINDDFPRHKSEENGEFRYFGFAEKAEPGVIDKLNGTLGRIGNGTKDYVALYSANSNDEDKITRQMLIGHDKLVETEVENMSLDAHRNSLTKLLNFDYVKVQPNTEK